jgi:antimicrobial peptide system SdpB family protein
VFEALFHLSILITLLWVLGWHTRLITLLTWVCLWSLHARNPTLWDGGDNLARIMLLYTCGARLGACWSCDAARRRTVQDGGRPALALLHNTALLACALQLCLVYGTAGLSKAAGELWQNGTALYYILRVEEFAWSGYGAAICRDSILVTLLTYGTLAFQLSFPFLFFAHPLTRQLVLAVGMLFHLGIGLILGLTTFAAFMISIELLFVSDRDYLALVHACGRLRAYWGMYC